MTKNSDKKMSTSKNITGEAKLIVKPSGRNCCNCGAKLTALFKKTKWMERKEDHRLERLEEEKQERLEEGELKRKKLL